MSIADLGSQVVNVKGLTFGSSVSPLLTYSSLTGAVAFNGAIVPPIPSTMLFKQVGGLISLTFTKISALASVPTTINAVLPINIPRPNFLTTCPVWVFTGASPATAIGNCSIDTGGNITLFVGYNGIFTPSGSVLSGFETFNMCYDISTQ